ncbi:hypothetical protein MishRS11D_30820 [Methylomagnum ishizawai]|nr:hypothetical protein MishRS11D_30820 [Methylomagnum ishizawai]
MEELGITQEDLVPLLGVKTRGAVGHYLTGRRDPSVAQLKALSKTLKMSLDILMFGDESVYTVPADELAPPPAADEDRELVPLTREEKKHITLYRRADRKTRDAVQNVYEVAKQSGRLSGQQDGINRKAG